MKTNKETTNIGKHSIKIDVNDTYSKSLRKSVHGVALINSKN